MNNDEKDPCKRYISYFQKVITIGVITYGETQEDAIEEAEVEVENCGNSVKRVFYGETKFELSDTLPFEGNPLGDHYLDLQEDLQRKIREKK